MEEVSGPLTGIPHCCEWGLYWGFYRDNGKENGNYYIIIGVKSVCCEWTAGHVESVET